MHIQYIYVNVLSSKTWMWKSIKVWYKKVCQLCQTTLFECVVNESCEFFMLVHINKTYSQIFSSK